MQMGGSSMDQESTLILSWTEKCTDVSLEYFHICESVLRENKDTIGPLLYFILLQLATSCQCASEGALLLVSRNYLWEAEVLVRSALEGTIKYIYLCTGDEHDRNKKAEEYWIDLPSIYEIRRNSKAVSFLTHLKNPDSPLNKPIRDTILTPDTINSIKQKYPKQIQTQLQQKWSIMKILSSLQDSEEDINMDFYHAFAGVLFGYDTASHISHQDGDCIGLQFDRVGRDLKRKEALEKAHAAREINEIAVLSFNRLTITRHMLGIDMDDLIELHKSHESLFSELKKVALDWYNVEYDYQSKRRIDPTNNDID